MTLVAGQAACVGLRSRIRPSRPAIVCLDCDRRITELHARDWPKYLTPPPAMHDGERWVCDKRVQAPTPTADEEVQA